MVSTFKFAVAISSIIFSAAGKIKNINCGLKKFLLPKGENEAGNRANFCIQHKPTTFRMLLGSLHILHLTLTKNF